MNNFLFSETTIKIITIYKMSQLGKPILFSFKREMKNWWITITYMFLKEVVGKKVNKNKNKNEFFLLIII